MKKYKLLRAWRKQRTAELSLAIVRSQISLSSSCSNPDSPLRTSNSLILRSVLWLLLHFAVLWQGHYHHQAECLGTSRQVRKGVISLASRNLEASREGKKKSVWFVYLVPRTFRDWKWRKGNRYVTCSVTENSYFSRKTSLLMLTTLPGIGSRVYWSHLVIRNSWEWSNLLSRGLTCKLFIVCLFLLIKAVP